MKNFKLIIRVILIVCFIRIIFLGNFYQLIQFFIEIIISSILCIAIHELGHISVGKFNKINTTIIYLGPFTFINEDSKRTIKFKMKYHKYFAGGCSGFHYQNINSEDTLNKVSKQFKNCFLGGPIVSILFGLIIILFGFYFKELLRNYKQFLLILSSISILMGLTTFFIGSDGKNAHTLENNRLLSIYILFTGILCSSGTKNIHSYKYLLSEFEKIAEDITYKNFSDKNTLLQMHYNYTTLYYYMAGIIKELPQNTIKSIDFVVMKKDELINNKRTKNLAIEFIYLNIIHLIIFKKDEKLAKSLYNFLKAHENNNPSDLVYSKLRAKYFLSSTYNCDYLIDKLYSDNAYLGYGFYEIEKNILKLKSWNGVSI